MIRDINLKITAVCLVVMLGIIGCGDDSTGPDPGEAPEIPELTAAEPDFSYFENTEKEKVELLAGEAFNNAQSSAFTAQLFFGFGQVGTTYFNMAENEDPSFEDGQWIWTYSASYEGQTVEFKLTANVNESANETNWAYYITVTGGEQEYEDYKYMEGTTSLDGNSGSWQINEYLADGTPDPVMTYEWNINADNDLSATFNFHDSDGIATISYEQDGTSHTLTMDATASNSGSNIEVYWDTDAEHGYWLDKGTNEQLCWSSDKSNISCSEIGF